MAVRFRYEALLLAGVVTLALPAMPAGALPAPRPTIGTTVAQQVAVAAGAGAVGAPSPPVVTSQPQMAIIVSPTNPTIEPTDHPVSFVTFSAAATGNPAPRVHWQEAADRRGPWSTISGATSSAIVVPVTTAHLGHAFRAVFSNPNGSAATQPVKLVSRSDWMGDLGDDIGDVPITELTIPGSHDSGTFDADGNGHTSTDHLASQCESVASSDAVCQSYAKAQSRDILQQLNDGIRYFDLRVCGSGDALPDFSSVSAQPVTCHELVSATLDKVLFQAATFAIDHPKEVLILDFNHHFQVNPDMEMEQIERAFLRPDGSSMLVPPEYCTPGNRDSGTCAGNLTLNTIRAGGAANVIVNFENDGAPGATRCGRYNSNNTCAVTYHLQPVFDTALFDRHQPLFWGRPSAAPVNMQYCTIASAFASCFGNTYDRFTALNRAKQNIDTRQTFAEHPAPAADRFQHFFVQFLQTTPNSEYIRENLGGSLLDMAEDSNPAVVPHIFGCGDWAIYDCFAQYRPENLNIVALNFYDRTDDGGIHVDFMAEIVKLDEYARTKPIVAIAAARPAAATGWYNAASLGGPGATLPLDVSATDYFYGTGISAVDCYDFVATVPVTASLPTSDSTTVATAALGDGIHSIDCRATDGANLGFHGTGNRGGGPGSTALPVRYQVDTTTPTIHCSGGNLLLHQPVTSIRAAVTDALSGPSTATVSGAVSTDQVGSFGTTMTATDKAGNPTTATCGYRVSYQTGLAYDPSQPVTAGGTMALKVVLSDAAGAAVGGLTVTADYVHNVSTGANTVPVSAGPSSTNRAFQPIAPAGYEYDLVTSGLAPGNYTVVFLAGADVLPHSLPFTVKAAPSAAP